MEAWWSILTLVTIVSLSWIGLWYWGNKEGYADGKKETLEIMAKEMSALKSVTVDNTLCHTCSHEYKADTFDNNIKKQQPEWYKKNITSKRKKSNASYKERRKLL